MNRKRIAFAAVAAVLVLSGAGAVPALADGTSTAASGQIVVNESTSFLTAAAAKGIVFLPVPPGQAGYTAAAGVTGTFPVTGGSGSISQFFGSVQAGGSVLVVDGLTGRSVTLTGLSFDDSSGVLSATPKGAAAPIAVLDPAGEVVAGTSASPQTISISESDLDQAAADYLNSALHTAFFTGGADFGALDISYTPAS